MSAWRADLKAQLGHFSLDVCLEGEAGVLALVGPNGSGKTTVLRLIAGAVPAQRAEVTVGGRVLESTRDKVRLPMEQRLVGYVPQGYGLFPHLTVLQNVCFGLASGPRRLPRRERARRGRALLGELGCAALADRRADALSGGERQRVALARALVIEPALLLLDEPLAALDVSTRRSVRRFLAARLSAYGKPTLLVTHDVRDVEALGATVCVLEAGRVVQHGSLDALRAEPSSEFVAELVGA